MARPVRLIPDTRQRRLEPERMDDPSLEAGPHRTALKGLARINRMSRSAETLWSGLRECAVARRGREARVLDIACGGGDVTVGVERLAEADGRDVHVDGCDISPTAVRVAKEAARSASVSSDFFEHDVLHGALPTGYDAIVCSLFLHHLTDDQAVDLLARASEAAPAVLVNDLARGGVGYVAASVGTRLLSRSPIVHFDGPRSVRAALTIDEARDVAERAGLRGARFRPVFPYRWLMTWSRA